MVKSHSQSVLRACPCHLPSSPSETLPPALSSLNGLHSARTLNHRRSGSGCRVQVSFALVLSLRFIEARPLPVLQGALPWLCPPLQVDRCHELSNEKPGGQRPETELLHQPGPAPHPFFLKLLPEQRSLGRNHSSGRFQLKWSLFLSRVPPYQCAAGPARLTSPPPSGAPPGFRKRQVIAHRVRPQMLPFLSQGSSARALIAPLPPQHGRLNGLGASTGS